MPAYSSSCGGSVYWNVTPVLEKSHASVAGLKLDTSVALRGVPSMRVNLIGEMSGVGIGRVSIVSQSQIHAQFPIAVVGNLGGSMVRKNLAHFRSPDGKCRYNLEE